MRKAKKRPGSTETFSVSVDAATKEALRHLADAEFGGNLSALISDFAEEARRRKAAADYLARHGLSKLGKKEAAALEAEIKAEVTKATKRSRKHVAA